jgi:hypothetical protein
MLKHLDTFILKMQKISLDSLKFEETLAQRRGGEHGQKSVHEIFPSVGTVREEL